MKLFKPLKYLKYFPAVIAVFFLLNSAGFCQMFSYEKNPNEHTAIFPSGTLLKGILQNEIDSSKNVMGDKVYLVVPSGVKIGKNTCIQKQSLIEGEVIQAQKAKIGRNGLLQLRFDKISFPDGTGTTLSAHVWSNKEKGILGGEITKHTLFRKMPHYIENTEAYAQLIPTGVRAMGKEEHFKPGAEFVIVLDNDLEVKYLEK